VHRRSEEEPIKSLPQTGEFVNAVVPTLGPETQIKKAADFLLRHRVAGAPVVDSDGRLAGIITETDLLKLVTGGIQGQRLTEATEYGLAIWSSSSRNVKYASTRQLS